MKARQIILVVTAVAFPAFSSVMANDGFKLPPEVTPKMRAACESDVRRLCIGENPTVDKVKSCVMSKFLRLGRKCQFEIAQAGLAP